MMNTTLNANQLNHKKTDETSTDKLLDEALLTWHMTFHNRQKDGVDNYKAVKIAESLDRIIDNSSVANKFPLNCESVVNNSTTDPSKHFLKDASENHDSTADSCESFPEQAAGSHFHIDFSSHENFDQSFEELIRQITYVENRLSLQPRRTPTPSSMIYSMQSVRMSTSDTIISSVTNNVYSRRFADIICKYKKSISKEHYELNQLQQNELSSLIIKLREELFCDAPQVLSDSKKSDDVIEKHHCGNHCLEQTRIIHQNDILLRLVDRLTTPKSMEENSSNSFFIGCFKIILCSMALWMLYRYIIIK
ncbi:unnamed protein product [Rotaria sordida]|uniref:Uncharacterized protein n=1 Tax=Rotaria sordida TaxID=392033 RepID=A0A815Q2H7_9BILA|nr:unnamed protein product [Rotaria sordida]CAF1640733.1 unnamed protein product [Rotaria sordida]